MELRFDIPVAPVPASRPRVAKFGVFYPKAHTAYATFLETFLKTIPETQFSGVVEARFLFVTPAFKGSKYPTSHSDVDNLVKLPLDCMTKSKRFWSDDDLIVYLTACKRFVLPGEEPHTKVRIIPLQDDIHTITTEAFEQ